MKILEIIKFLTESAEKERLFKTADELDKAYGASNEHEKERFFRKITNAIEDQLSSLTDEKETQSLRNQIFSLPSIKSFGLQTKDIEGLRAILGEAETDAYSRFLSDKKPILSDGWLKGLYQEIDNYISPELKRGRKAKKEWTLDGQISLDISKIFQSLASIKPGTAGPFELLLCMIFGGKKIENKSNLKGDIVIDNVPYEVKANGTGAIDAGYRQLEEELKTAQGDELNILRQKVEQEKKKYDAEIAKCTKLAQKFAKVLSKEYNLNDKDVKDYFSILSEEDKKRAILYGFYECGYRNFIICNPKKSTTDYDVYIKIVTSKMIENVIHGKGVSIKSIGIDIIDASGNYTNTCRFGDYLIKMV